MEFQTFEDLEKYIKHKAIEKTKFKLKIIHLSKKKYPEDSLLNTLYKFSLKEVKNEILEEYKNGEIEVLEKNANKTKTL